MVVVLSVHEKSILVSELNKKGNTLTQFLAGISAEPILSYNFNYLENYVKDISSRDEDIVYAVVLDKGGNPLTHLEQELKSQKNVMEFSSPITQNNEEIGRVKIVFTTNNIAKSLRKSQMIILTLCLATMVAISLIVYFLFRVVAQRPIERPQDCTGRSRVRGFLQDGRGAYRGRDRRMGKATNKMIGDLKSLVKNIFNITAKTASATNQITASSGQGDGRGFQHSKVSGADPRIHGADGSLHRPGGEEQRVPGDERGRDLGHHR